MKMTCVSALVSLSCLGLAPGAWALDCSADEFSEPGAVGVELYFQEIDAIYALDGALGSLNDRDELYIRVVGRTAAGGIDQRLPLTSYDTDYYEFSDGHVGRAGAPNTWTNQDTHIPFYPRIWQGALPADGDRAEFLVVVMEKESPLDPTAAIELVFGTCATVATGTATLPGAIVGGVCAVGAGLVSMVEVETEDEPVAAFLVTVENNGGTLQTTYLVADELVGVSGAHTTLLTGSEDGDPYLTHLEGALEGEAVLIEGVKTTERGHYTFTVVSAPLCPGSAPSLAVRLWDDDLEVGNCDDSQPVEVATAFGDRLAMSPGDSVYLLPDGDRDIEYWCDGTYELETDLFDRDYSLYAVDRTTDEIGYHPYTLEPYIPAGGDIGAAVGMLVVPETEGVELHPGVGPQLLTWGFDDCLGVEATPDEEVGLALWYDPGAGDNVTSADLMWQGCAGQTRAGYAWVAEQARAFRPDLPQPSGTIPLFTWYSPSRQDYWTTTQHPKDGLEGRDLSPDYVFVRVEGYVYPPELVDPKGVVPLYSWWSPSRGDNYLSATWAGKVGSKKSPDYEFVRLEGYGLP